MAKNIHRKNAMFVKSATFSERNYLMPGNIQNGFETPAKVCVCDVAQVFSVRMVKPTCREIDPDSITEQQSLRRLRKFVASRGQ